MIPFGGHLEISPSAAERYRRQALLAMAPSTTYSCYGPVNYAVKGGSHLSAEVGNQIRTAKTIQKVLD